MKHWDFDPDFNVVTVNYVNFVINNLESKGYDKKISQQQMADFLKQTFFKHKFSKPAESYQKEFVANFTESMTKYASCFVLKKAYFYPCLKSYENIAYSLFGSIENVSDAIKIVKKAFELRNGKDYPDSNDLEMAVFVHPEIKLHKIKNVA